MIRQLKKVFITLTILICILDATDMKSTENDETTKKIVKQDFEKKSKSKFSEKSKYLSFDQFIKEVDQNFPLLSAAFQDMKIAEGELLSSKGAFDPVIKGAGTTAGGYYNNSRFDTVIEQPTSVRGTSFFAGYRIGRGNFPPYYGERETNRYGEFRAGAKIPLWRDVAIDNSRAGLKQAQIGLRLADLSVLQQKVEIFRNAALRYWDWVSAVEKYKIAKSLYDIALERQKQIERRVKAGDLAKIEQIDNERILLQRESMLLGAEQMMEIMANELNIYLEGSLEVSTTLNSVQLPPNPFSQIEDILKIDLNKEIETAIEKRPELLRFQAQKDQNRIDQELAKNQMKPGVDLVVAASQDLGPGSPTRSKTEFEASVVLNVPLVTRKQEGKLNATVAKNKKLDAQEEFLRSRIHADIKNQYKILETTRQRSALAKKELELAQKLETAEINRFKIGEGTLIVVNIREQTTAEAAFREIDAKADHNKAIVNFKAALVDNLPK